MGDPTSYPRDATRRTDTRDPHAARERALKILFQADVRQVAIEGLLERLEVDGTARAILDDVDVEGLEEVRASIRTDAAPAERTRAAIAAAGAGVPPLDGFTRSLVLGVAATQPELDGLIGRFARRWQVSRMPAVDRTVLRLATYELLHEPTPPPVVIDEAVGFAKALSTDDSGRYVNGVLESIRRTVAEKAAAEGPEAEGTAPDGADPDDADAGAASSD